MATETMHLRYVAAPADLPRGTLTELFFRTIEKFDKADALRWRDGAGAWHSMSHARILEDVRRAGLGLESLGVRRGDRVALLSENRPEWALADYASLCVGALDVPVYATLPPHQTAFILQDSGARALFVSTAQQLAKIREVWAELPGLERVIVFDEVPMEGDRVLTWRTLLERGRAEEAAGKGTDFRERALATSPDDVATLIYTSGTTGEPKGVMLTHDNLHSNVEATGRAIHVDETNVALSFLPLSHVLQRMVDYYLFGHGVTIAYLASFDLVAKGLAEVKPQVVVSTPRVYEKFYARVLSATGVKRRLVLWARRVGEEWAAAKLAGREPSAGVRAQYALADRLVFAKLRAAIGGKLNFFISGGAPLAPQIAKFFYAARIMILEGYGLTETSPVTNVNTPEAFRIGTVGKPVPGTEIRIADDGEILVRGPQVMKGYYNRPEATRQAIDAEGWFYTGDIGEIDAEGFLRITDRKKDIIVTAGGKNIAPQPIENLAKQSRYVAEALMIGDRRPYPVMLVLPAFEALEQWAREQGIPFEGREQLLRDPRVQERVEADVFKRFGELARYETPKKLALLEHELSIERGELTPKLSVRRRVVEQHYAQVIEQLYAEPATVMAE